MNGQLSLEDLKRSGRATITVEECALVLGIGRGAAYNAVKNGEIPSLSLGRKILCPVPALLRLLEGE
jgi:excisionase family DNA binding protein